MQHAQYLRIEALAGGVHCTRRGLIRAARSRLSRAGKSRCNRPWRHDWLRSGLQQLVDARHNYFCTRGLGGLTINIDTLVEADRI